MIEATHTWNARTQVPKHLAFMRHRKVKLTDAFETPVEKDSQIIGLEIAMLDGAAAQPETVANSIQWASVTVAGAPAPF